MCLPVANGQVQSVTDALAECYRSTSPKGTTINDINTEGRR